MNARRDPASVASAALDELRELVRDAHGAIRDLDRLLGDYRRIARDAANDARAKAQEAAAVELESFAAHLQTEANRMAAELNRSVHAAQRQIVRQLEVAEMGETKDGKLWVKFNGAPFDEHVPVAIGTAGECPVCHGTIKAAIDKDGQEKQPKQGYLAVCDRCGALMQYQGEPLALVQLSMTELKALAVDRPRAAARAIALALNVRAATLQAGTRDDDQLAGDAIPVRADKPSSGIAANTRCPSCDKLLDAATDPTGEGKRPIPGSLSVCLGCGALAQFAGEPDALTLIPLNDDALAELRAEDPKSTARALRLAARVELAHRARIARGNDP